MLEVTAKEKSRIIVFIADVSPTEEERALAEKHNTGVFLTTTVPVGRVIPHRLAVAVKGVKIPEGYTTKLEETKATPAPAKSPTAPTAPVATGALGVQSEGNPFHIVQ